MNPAWIYRRFAHAIWLALVFLFCGCDRPTEEIGTLFSGVALGVMGTLVAGAVFGTRR